MTFAIKNNISWVGKIDWELRKFHGEEYSTHHGSSYNSYLIRDEKTVLIDTVWGKFSNEFVENLQKEVNLDQIDFIIINHAESDHSGSLPELMRHIPDTPIYCTSSGIDIINGHYHKDWNFNPVKTGDKLNLGSKDIVFIEAKMLHWPDSMMSYLTKDNILFSNDAFGQHLASELMYNDLVDQCELFREAIKYYANILTPFSSLVDKKIREVLALNVPVDMICPSHGVLWRKDPLQIVTKYAQWASGQAENQITVAYDSMWEGTRHMAEAIVQGISKEDPSVGVKLFNIARSDKNDLITEIFRSKAILIGSPTINNGILSSVAAILEEIKGLRFKNKKAAAFGCYGWSGESVRIISERLTESGFSLLNAGLKEKWSPGSEAIEHCLRFGQEVALQVKGP
ncbi:MAG: anaerobic nitric oxide reductase flavorubredoxin [Desulfobacteraceae bacterium]|nr:anaerobic nitric oxide reductase flavorubredoxin [Desulfobacteraceae bacterium]